MFAYTTGADWTTPTGLAALQLPLTPLGLLHTQYFLIPGKWILP